MLQTYWALAGHQRAALLPGLVIAHLRQRQRAAGLPRLPAVSSVEPARAHGSPHHPKPTDCNPWALILTPPDLPPQNGNDCSLRSNEVDDEFLRVHSCPSWLKNFPTLSQQRTDDTESITATYRPALSSPCPVCPPWLPKFIPVPTLGFWSSRTVHKAHIDATAFIISPYFSQRWTKITPNPRPGRKMRDLARRRLPRPTVADDSNFVGDAKRGSVRRATPGEISSGVDPFPPAPIDLRDLIVAASAELRDRWLEKVNAGER